MVRLSLIHLLMCTGASHKGVAEIIRSFFFFLFSFCWQPAALRAYHSRTDKKSRYTHKKRSRLNTMNTCKWPSHSLTFFLSICLFLSVSLISLSLYLWLFVSFIFHYLTFTQLSRNVYFLSNLLHVTVFLLL